MGTIHFSSPISSPDPTDPSHLMNQSSVQAAIADAIGSGGATGSVITTLQKSWTPELDRYPMVDAENGPLIADSGIVSGDVSVTTGLQFVPWDAVDAVTGQPIFNYQGMVPAPAPSNIQSAAGRSCLLNASTPRWHFGNAGQYKNGNQSIRVGIASTRVIPVWYCGQGQINATSLDMHVMVEHQGQNKHLSSSDTVADGLPRTLSGGSGTYRRELTYSEHRYREHRFLLGPNGYFIGCWIDTKATIRRPKNRPQLFVHGGDSWNDSQAWYSSPGYGWPSGDYQCLPLCVVSSFRTGMAHGSDAQGGTGEYNPNGTEGGDLESYNGYRSSAAWSDSRVNWRRDWWSGQFPIFTDIGGWNDGNSMETPYQTKYRDRVAARVQKTIDRIAAFGGETRFINVGIQPVEITLGTNDPKWLAALGQAELPSLFPGVVIGHVPLMPMWSDTSTTGPRDLYCNDSDNIHLVAAGDDAVSGYIWDKAGEFLIDQDFLNNTTAAGVPIVDVPTS